MKYKEIIEKLMDEILEDEIDFLFLKNKLEDFKLLLIRLTGLDLENQSNKEDIQFKNGIALSPTFAALCIDDIIRTRQFIRGIYQAVKQVSHLKSKPIKIFYAGSGPFATLILPLLTKYSPDDLQVTLLEVNKKTINYLRLLIKELGIDNYIEKIICEDASIFNFDKETRIDVLISETMQHGLVNEQQVPIMMNLVHQLNEEVIIIPNKIRLDLALMNSSSKLILEGAVDLKYKKLKLLLDFDQQFIHSYIKKTPLWKQDQRFELCKQLPFRDNNDKDYDKLVVLTSIQVYKEEWINVDSSSLTIPKILFNLQSVSKQKKEISLYYVVKKIPDFDFELN